MKVVIVGASGHVNYVFESIDRLDNCYISACAKGSDEENIDMIPEDIKRYDSYIEMFEKEKPEIAVINPYFSYHSKIAKEALSRDIHVFCEKPVSTTFKQLKELTETYEASSALLGGMFGIRYRSEFITAKKLVLQDEIGKIRLINTQKSYKLGNRGENYKDRQLYGGTIPWVGSHAIDWIHWITNKEFKSVYARHSNMYNNNHNDLETTALIIYELEDEIIASVTIDYFRPNKAKSHDDDRIRIVGTKGIIEIKDNKVSLINNNTNTKEYYPQETEEYVFVDFIKFIKGQKSRFEKENAIRITNAALCARESADNNKIVKIKRIE